MHSIEHENIVRLYGVVLDTTALMLVTELAHLRSLLECLKDSGLRVSFLTVPTLCEFAQQICSGMMYLENKRLIHRDLAARNILVFSKSKVKISDFGLSRALGVGKDYYQTNFNVNLKLPIAWCAPECINFLRFTNASDVWAFGVCLWEMFSYGFQPWAALTGHQILEAIDEPNYQRLEQPECCPKEYYTLMLKCWQHDPAKRPKFGEIHTLLPDMRPEQLKAVTGCSEAKKDFLMYRQNDIITVLDKPVNTGHWKGVLNSGKTGMFNPSNTVAYLGNSLPSSVNRDSFSRTAERASSKRKLCPEMISGPQNDLKHTGHVGLDGAYFGDVAFLSSSSSPAPSVSSFDLYFVFNLYFAIINTPCFSSTMCHVKSSRRTNLPKTSNRRLCCYRRHRPAQTHFKLPADIFQIQTSQLALAVIMRSSTHTMLRHVPMTDLMAHSTSRRIHALPRLHRTRHLLRRIHLPISNRRSRAKVVHSPMSIWKMTPEIRWVRKDSHREVIYSSEIVLRFRVFEMQKKTENGPKRQLLVVQPTLRTNITKYPMMKFPPTNSILDHRCSTKWTLCSVRWTPIPNTASPNHQILIAQTNEMKWPSLRQNSNAKIVPDCYLAHWPENRRKNRR